MSKRKLNESTTQPQLFTSTPIHDRSSTFTAVFTPSTASPHTLQSHPPFASAMHRMLAWRKPSAQRSLATSFGGGGGGGSQTTSQKVICETGSDEDGEKWAGKKLEKVLTDLDVQGAVVVARWYGGVLLGPVRFKWIEDSAREAIGMWKASLGDEVVAQGDVKRVKVGGEAGREERSVVVVDDEKEKGRLVQVLNERDASVSVLRGLLAEKNAMLKAMEDKEQSRGNEVSGHGTQGEISSSPAAVVLDYNSMSVQRLKQLEKARDATLSWILKQIDMVEEKIKTVKETKDGD